MKRNKRFFTWMMLSGTTLYGASASCIEQFNGEIQTAFLAATNIFIQDLALELLNGVVGVDNTGTIAGM